MAIRVCILEDDPKASETLRSYLLRYGSENDLEFSITAYENAVLLLEHYSPDYDIIYMDIQMPFLNGMDAARKLRRLDTQVLLVFVTTLAQYALEGYEVSAQDYIVKPVNYFDFAMKLTRTLDRLPQTHEPEILVLTDAGTQRIRLNDVYYVEVSDHYLLYHTRKGEYRQYGAMSKLENELSFYGFARCNSCYLVNLKYVMGVNGFVLQTADGELQISRPKKKQFMDALERYMKH